VYSDGVHIFCISINVYNIKNVSNKKLQTLMRSRFYVLYLNFCTVSPF
jgi:hypothetical protein